MFKQSVFQLILAVFVSSTLFVIGGCTVEKEKQSVSHSDPSFRVNPQSVLLSTIGDSFKPDLPKASSDHSSPDEASKGPAQFIIELNQNGKGVAYLAAVNDRVCVVHNDKPGKKYHEIEPYTMTVSPNGQRIAYGARYDNKWYAVVDDIEYGPYLERGRLTFSPDSKHVAYEAKIGTKWFMFVDKTAGTGSDPIATKVYFNNQSDKLAYVTIGENEDKKILLHVSDVKFIKEHIKEIATSKIALSYGKNRLAAIINSSGKQQTIEFSFDKPDDVTTGPLYDEIRDLTYGQSGDFLAYYAKKGDENYIVLNGKQEKLPKGEYPLAPVIRPDNKGVGILIYADNKAYLYQAFHSDGHKTARFKECAELSYSNDGRSHAYVAIKNEKFMIVVNGIEGPYYDRVVTPMFSPDNKYLVYRARKDNKRFVVVADTMGKIIREHPGYERVFETSFTDDGKSVAYGVKDGNHLMWKVEKL